MVQRRLSPNTVLRSFWIPSSTWQQSCFQVCDSLYSQNDWIHDWPPEGGSFCRPGTYAKPIHYKLDLFNYHDGMRERSRLSGSSTVQLLGTVV
jgi:hypothetical protein